MALSMKCDKGHSYVQPDIIRGLKHGAPICPECREEWLLEQWVSCAKEQEEEEAIMVEARADCVHNLIVQPGNPWSPVQMSYVLGRIEEFEEVRVRRAGEGQYVVEVQSDQSTRCVAELVQGTLEYEEKKARSVPTVLFEQTLGNWEVESRQCGNTNP